MMRLTALTAILAAGLTAGHAADSVVVFSEINYHPKTNEAALEWVELHNQMAVDIDLSAWTLGGGIDYEFPDSTIISGGGYLVIAGDPAALAASAGLTGVAGPFAGRLNNSSGTLTLRDRNRRLMDRVEYGDSDKWPVEPDGSGATLAKQDPNTTSGSPEHWVSSIVTGGTPGFANFPEPLEDRPQSLVPFNASWRFEASGQDLGIGWRSAGFDDSNWGGGNTARLVSYWPFDGNATAVRGVNGSLSGSVTSTTDRNGQSGGALAFNGSLQQHVLVSGGGGLNGASAGTISLWVKWSGTQDADCCGSYGAVLARQANGQFSDNILALNNANPASARIVWRQSGGPAPVLLTSTTVAGTGWHHIAITFESGDSTLFVDGLPEASAMGSALNSNPSIPLALGAWNGDGGGYSTSSMDDVAIWDRALSPDQISQLADQSQEPLDFGNPNSAVYYAGNGRLETEDELRQTLLPLGPTTYYFRTAFEYSENPARTLLSLDLAVNDGAVLYLNDTEIYRHNMPPGPVTAATLASSAVGVAPVLKDIALPSGSLLSGSNVVAVEVHQASSVDPDMIFGAALWARPILPSPELFDAGDLVFNEVSGTNDLLFQVELINHGTEMLDLAGHTILRTGVSPDQTYVFPAQILAPGDFVVLTEALLGFIPVPGDKLFLFLPEGDVVADAVEMEEQHRGRSPDGLGSWLFPDVPTFGAVNSFAFHDEVVINEIMYHAPPTPETTSQIGTVQLVTLTNTWRYDQSGTDLGTAWVLPEFDDSGWEIGEALFTANFTSLEAPTQTELVLGPSTYYFRASFEYTGTPEIQLLQLRHLVDDGVVIYLNGNEFHRFNLPRTGQITYTNLAGSSITAPRLLTPITIPLQYLIIGNNVLAVEIHQATVSGNDIAFGAQLEATQETIPAMSFTPSSEQWIELFNRSDQPVDLTGWRLDEGIDFRFADGTMIPPGGYLVVAKDLVAMQAAYPDIELTGPYDNSLSRSGEAVALKDQSNNPVDRVHYFDDGRWPDPADGGGASLELRDPRADNRAAEAWAASDERLKSSWQTYAYRGTASSSSVGPDGQWHEFVLGLLEVGEVWLDDIRVTENPASTRIEMLQNGTFQSGLNAWRIIGNHQGEVIDDPDQPGNKVLRLTATGTTEHMSNHGETTLVGNRDIVNGREYEISFRARWINGSRQLLTRLYFNRLPRVTGLRAPALHGSPGRSNSTLTTNIGPTYASLRHDPPVPAPFEPVLIHVQAKDPDGITSLTLWSSVDGGAWSSRPMTGAGDGMYEAELSGQSAGTVVQFYVEGQDGMGATSRFPAAGPDSRALFKVDDGLAATHGLHNFRLIVLTQDGDRLHQTINLMSNGRVGCTVIYDEHDITYDCGLRLKGSEHSRTTTARLGFNVKFPSDRLFRGVHSTVAIDRSESTGFGQREILIHQTANHAGRLPTKYNDLIQVMTPRLAHTGAAELQLARYGDVFLENQFDQGDDGTLYEYELVYQLNSTDNGSAEGNKVPAPDSVRGTPIRNLGDDKERYRWTYLIKNNRDRDDFRRIMEFAKTMGLSGSAFNTQIGQVIDVDQWLRAMALTALSGAGDCYGGDGAQHNAMFYVRPADNKVLYLQHDVDAFFNATRPIVPNGDVGKIIAVPARARAYYSHLLDIMDTTYNGTYMGRWADHFGQLLPGQNFSGHLSFLIQRAAYVRGRINSIVPNATFAISSNGGNDFSTANASIVLSGNGPIEVAALTVNGTEYPLTWNTLTGWTITVPLFNGMNILQLQALDGRGQPLPGMTDTITVTSTGPGAPRPLVINEWMADNAGPGGFPDPQDGLYQDWFELFNPNVGPVDLSGYFLTDDLSLPGLFEIPTGTTVPGGGFLLVWADNQTNQNGQVGSDDLHVSFQLNRDGENIALFSPGLVAQHVVSFGPQGENLSQGLFPDGDTNLVFLMTNWTPRTSNTLENPVQPEIQDLVYQSGGVFSFAFTGTPGRAYQVQFKDDLGGPVWMPLGPPRTSPTGLITVIDIVGAVPQRFYRVILVP